MIQRINTMRQTLTNKTDTFDTYVQVLLKQTTKTLTNKTRALTNKTLSNIS